MTQLPHLFPANTSTTEPYVYARTVMRGEFRLPPRDRVRHGEGLVQKLEAARGQTFGTEEAPIERHPKGLLLDFQSDPGLKLRLESLDSTSSGIQLRNTRIENNVMHATVFVPEAKISGFIKKFEAYVRENTATGKAKNKTLVESIRDVRLAVLSSFWTDSGSFPQDRERRHWWEVWLDVAGVGISDFRRRAADYGIIVADGAIQFPERLVCVAHASVGQWLAFENLFDVLAELRLAKALTGEFLQLSPKDQAEFVEEALRRVSTPAPDAPSVCHLDTGVNRGHPLLEIALAEEHLLACDPSWSPADRHGHGTEMAGLALYGCLTTLLEGNGDIPLLHRLESVKIWPDHGRNEPHLYGYITNQAISRIEVAASSRVRRSYCLTVTADGRDEGLPSSWSAELDQATSGAAEVGAPRRLVLVSIGNTESDRRHEYPAYNHLSGAHDPAQAWNALTVGAYTEKVVIHDPTYANWKSIAKAGTLSPCSRTSLVWSDNSWPFKPDVVMEGGNEAIDPSTGRADNVDDLRLLTTRVDASGALLTSSGDTSGAAALASRYAAIIWAHYPALWPETVRALLVHSARWTERMIEEFPQNQRHQRLRCYGFGVPNLGLALWSAANSATLLVEESLQPFHQVSSTVKTKDMHCHRLPWPKEVLQSLGSTPVRMRVTLSYFIEPSPGRRGWGAKHRYQSHGLRFDIKRPLENEAQFLRRISRATWEEDEEVDFGRDSRDWELGAQLRCRGSLHSDTWVGSAAELAECGNVAVFPVTGWWKERHHLRGWEKAARYSLVVSIETLETSVDLYTPIAAQIRIPVGQEVEV